jgi:hypothetical protein
MDTSLLLHDPPLAASVSVISLLMHNWVGPLIVPAAGLGFTVMAFNAWQPVASVYTIVTDPTDTPPTIPVDEPAVAMAELLLLQVPPGTLFVKVVAAPVHAIALPDIAAGRGFMVATEAAAQPLARV